MQFYTLSSKMSIDKLMVRCFSQSIYTYKMLNKPIQQGYKVFGIADYRYLYAFLWSSKAKGLQDVVLCSKLTATGKTAYVFYLS
jgi:hypothetical protein